MNKTTFLALALAVGASTAAQASSTATIVSNLNVTTIDLNPYDNAGPSYQPLLGGAPTTISALAGVGITKEAPGLFTPLSAIDTNANNDSTAQATIGPTGFALSSSGNAWADLASGNPVGIGHFPNLHLAPWTAILITGDYQVVLDTSCTASGPATCNASVELKADFPDTGFNINFDGTPINGESAQSTSFEKFFSIQSGSQTFTGSAGTTYWNFSDKALDLTLRFTARASTSFNNLGASATAVPEPASVALMLAGLATAALARRQQGSRRG